MRLLFLCFCSVLAISAVNSNDVKKQPKATITYKIEPTVETSERRYQDGDKSVIETTTKTTKPTVTITKQSSTGSNSLPNSRLVVRPSTSSSSSSSSSVTTNTAIGTSVAPKTSIRSHPLMPPRKPSCLMHCPLFVEHVCTVRYFKGRLEFYSFLNNCNLDLFNCVNPVKKYFKFTNENMSCEDLNIPILRA